MNPVAPVSAIFICFVTVVLLSGSDVAERLQRPYR
jgi:hypothetical protein